MNWRRHFGLLTALMLWTAYASAGDVAVLRNGFSIPHQRREAMGASTRLYMDAEGKSYVDVPTAEIAGIESQPDAPSEQPAGSATIADSVSVASSQTGIDPELINSVIKAESGFNPKAVSRKGARGLMQLMPATAQSLGVGDPFDPQANVQAGTQYLRQLLLQYHSDLVKALAAYNAGPERVSQYHGVPPYRETNAYVGRVIREFNRRKLTQDSSLRKRAAVPPTEAQSSSPEPGK